MQAATHPRRRGSGEGRAAQHSTFRQKSSMAMDVATFPQFAGEIFIRPASPARSSSSSQTSVFSIHRKTAAEMEEQRTGTPLSSQQEQSRFSWTPTDQEADADDDRQSGQHSAVEVIMRGEPPEISIEIPSSSGMLVHGQPTPIRSPEDVPKAGKWDLRVDRRTSAGLLRRSFEWYNKFSHAGIVTAEITTNCVITNEYDFLTRFSAFLAQKYSREQDSIAITLKHSTCVFLGGSFGAAYLMTITALPEFVTPTVNKRNASLIQQFMNEELSVLPERGIVRFAAIANTCLACNKLTVEAAADEFTNQWELRNPEEAARLKEKSKTPRRPWRDAPAEILSKIGRHGTEYKHSMMGKGKKRAPGTSRLPQASREGHRSDPTHAGEALEGADQGPSRLRSSHSEHHEGEGDVNIRSRKLDHNARRTPKPHAVRSQRSIGTLLKPFRRTRQSEETPSERPLVASQSKDMERLGSGSDSEQR